MDQIKRSYIAVFDIYVYATDKIDTIISCPDMNHYEPPPLSLSLPDV